MNDGDVYQWAYRYLNEGESCLRANRGLLHSEAIIAGIRAGNDMRVMIRHCISELGSCERLAGQISSVIWSLVLRVVVIILVIFLIRVMVLVSIADAVWVDWNSLDRAAIMTLLLLICCALYIWQRYDKSGNAVRISNCFLDEWFANYLILNPAGTERGDLRFKLWEARINAIRGGADGSYVSQLLYLDHLSEHVLWLRRYLERLPMIGMAIEMAMFVVFMGGLLVVPFFAWLETRSGGG